MSKETWYRCEACGSLHSHKNSYNDQYCYDCIDIMKGELTPEAKKRCFLKTKMRKKNKTQTTYDEVEKYCKEEYRARYLKMRNRAVLNLVLPKHPVLKACVEGIDKATLIEFAKDIQTYARAFRQVIEDHPEWTNEQEKYEKMIKEQEKEIDLGYTPKLFEQIEKLSTL